MAALSLMASQSPQVQELLASLAKNTPVPEPSLWPFALGYWLILILVIGLFIGSLIYNKKTRDWRLVKHKLLAIKKLPTVQQQNDQTHQLLRWVLIHKLNLPAAMTAEEFKLKVSATLSNTHVSWLNQHYQLEACAPDWSQVERLIGQWRKEVKR